MKPLSGLPDHVVAMKTSGRISGSELDIATDRIDAALRHHDRISLYFEIDSLEVTPKALLKDLRYGLKQLTQLDRFYRAVIVTDQSWVHTAAEWEDRLLPSITVRAFPENEKEEAREWVAKAPPEPRPKGLEEIPTSTSHVVAFRLKGTITGADIDVVADRLETAYQAHDHVNLLLRVESAYRFQFDVLREALFDLKAEAARHLERYAVVGGPKWLAGLVEAVNPLFRLEISHFHPEEEQKAWAWIGAQSKEDSEPSRVSPEPSE